MTDKMKEILIKYFVKFYGENYRTLITQKINTIIPISYDSLETKTSLKYEKQSTKEIELTLKFLKHHDIELPEEIKEKISNEKKNNKPNYLIYSGIGLLAIIFVVAAIIIIKIKVIK